YEIRIQGHLSPQWSEWFGGLTVINGENGEAVLTGWLADKAALYGILNQIQALNLTLIAANPLPDSPAGSSVGSPTDSSLGE
ncbi:MAG TPA: hypothetical protein PLK31_26950, partial [Chloroflexota bacterium]|nr:hypothetical protein [Chloroflexota bacterium]